MTDPDLPDRLFIFLVWRWLLELSHFEEALTILAVVGIVPFLATLETFHILQVNCLSRIRYFRHFRERRPRRSLAGESLFPGF